MSFNISPLHISVFFLEISYFLYIFILCTNNDIYIGDCCNIRADTYSIDVYGDKQHIYYGTNDGNDETIICIVHINIETK